MSGAQHMSPWRITADVGDWNVSNDKPGSTCCQAIENAEGEIVAFAVARSDDPWTRPDSEPIARQIAAQPLLLVACEAAWQCIAELSPTQARVEVAQLLRTAIEKSTGIAS